MDLLSAALRADNGFLARGQAAKGVPAMTDFDPRLLLLMLLTLAEAFLIWAVWQLQKELNKVHRPNRRFARQISHEERVALQTPARVDDLKLRDLSAGGLESRAHSGRSRIHAA
jgi:hypothetical protein